MRVSRSVPPHIRRVLVAAGQSDRAGGRAQACVRRRRRDRLGRFTRRTRPRAPRGTEQRGGATDPLCIRRRAGTMARRGHTLDRARFPPGRTNPLPGWLAGSRAPDTAARIGRAARHRRERRGFGVPRAAAPGVFAAAEMRQIPAGGAPGAARQRHYHRGPVHPARPLPKPHHVVAAVRRGAGDCLMRRVPA